MHRRPVHSKRNNRLNVLIAGRGGCGKSTLVNALCAGHEIASTTEWLDAPASSASQPRPLKLRTYTEDMADPDLGSVTLRMVETQGLGDNIDNRQQIDDVVKYIEGQYDEVLAEESRIKRNPRFTDNRVHVVIYMIEPTGHGLRHLDIEFMLRVGALSNLIPVLSKADSLTPAEILVNKRLVHEDIEHYHIPIFQFYNDGSQRAQLYNSNSQKSLRAGEESDLEDTEAQTPAMRKLQESLPLAIVAASKTVAIGENRAVLARRYPWGLVQIADPHISDFSTLKEILLYSHMEDLKEFTNDFLYEQYRTSRLSADPEFNAAVSAASAPITASRVNLAAVAGNHPGQQNTGYRQVSTQSTTSQTGHPGSRVVSTSSATGGQEYVMREQRLKEKEELLHRDEKLVQSEIELRRQELRKRELELQRLEEKLRRESLARQADQI